NLVNERDTFSTSDSSVKDTWDSSSDSGSDHKESESDNGSSYKSHVTETFGDDGAPIDSLFIVTTTSSSTNSTSEKVLVDTDGSDDGIEKHSQSESNSWQSSNSSYNTTMHWTPGEYTADFVTTSSNTTDLHSSGHGSDFVWDGSWDTWSNSSSSHN